MRKIEIEIIKSKISQYDNLRKSLLNLYEERSNLIYNASGVKAVQYDRLKGNSNQSLIDMNKIIFSDKLEILENKIKEKREDLLKVKNLLAEIDKVNRKLIVEGAEMKPSKLLICVLCKEKSNQEAIKYFGFNNKVSMFRYIDKVIEGIL